PQGCGLSETSWDSFHQASALVGGHQLRRGAPSAACRVRRQGRCHALGRASIPKSALTRSYQASSSSAPQATHSSWLIALREPRYGMASGPTGCRSCHVTLTAISSTFSATTVGGTGFVSALLKSAATRCCCG